MSQSDLRADPTDFLAARVEARWSIYDNHLLLPETVVISILPKAALILSCQKRIDVIVEVDTRVNDTDSTFSLDLMATTLAVRGVCLSIPRSLLNTPTAQNLARVSTVEST